MAQYRAAFVKVDGLKETDIGPTFGLAATDRNEAETEAMNLPAPEGANFVKLFRDGQYEPPKLGFAL